MCGRGYLVVGVGRNVDALEELAEKYPECFRYVAADLVEPSSLDRVEDVVRELGGLNVLVNNAGFGLAKPVLGHSEEEVEALFLVNAVRPIQLILRLVRYMSEGGVVVNVVTAGVHVLMKDFPIYGASKSALSYASKVFRDELRGRGIHLVEVYPGPVKTRFFERAGVKTPLTAVSAEKVAEAILRAVEKKRKTVYVPFPLRLLSVFGPLPFKA